MMGVSQAAPVPPGPMDLANNKYFVTDDRYDDGWSIASYQGDVLSTNPGVSGGTWNVSRNGSLYFEEIKAPYGKTNHVRMKVKFDYQDVSAGARCYADIFTYNGTGGTSQIAAEALANGNLQISLNTSSGGSSSVELPYDFTSYFWIDLSHGFSDATGRVYDSSGNQIWSMTKYYIWGTLESHARIYAVSNGGGTNSVYCDQLSYNDWF